jgi:hypothetical protein
MGTSVGNRGPGRAPLVSEVWIRCRRRGPAPASTAAIVCISCVHRSDCAATEPAARTWRPSRRSRPRAADADSLSDASPLRLGNSILSGSSISDTCVVPRSCGELRLTVSGWAVSYHPRPSRHVSRRPLRRNRAQDADADSLSDATP